MATETSENIEEERRLLHVAMTRAKDELDLIVPQRVFRYQKNENSDRHVYASISRFIPKSIHGAFELQHWSERPSGPDTRKSKSRSSKIDVGQSIGRMWR
jgi:ATP-dependent DNA helicase UvrD/PcrA